jgi:hypothetical protein
VADAQGRGWGAPCQGGRTTLVRADGLRLPVRTELADLIALLLDLTEAGGYDVIPGWTWGNACRVISGTTTWSNHAWGLAVDINAPANPYASADWHRRNARGTRPFGLSLVCDMPEQMVTLWENHGFRWGGRYTGKPDPMHYEFMGTPADAGTITGRLRAFLGATQPAPPVPAPLPPAAPPTVKDDDDMHLFHPHQTISDKGTMWLLLGGTLARVNKAEFDALVKAKVTVTKVDDAGWQAMKRAATVRG